MLRLPAALERKLQQLFPKSIDRTQFVVDLIEAALAARPESDIEGEQVVGGTLHLFTDGGSRGNPGQAAIGIVLEDPSQGKVIREHYERIGIGTNNVAEYRALIEGLKLAKRYHPNRLICHLDSELIVRQVNGSYKVKMPTLQPLFDEIRALSQDFREVAFVHIPRIDNHRADALVNRALDEHPAPHYEKP